MSVSFPHLTGKASVAVHDVAPQIPVPFDRRRSEYATTTLKSRKVEVKVNSHILGFTDRTIETKEKGITSCGMLNWTAGSKSIPLIDRLNLRKTEHGLTCLVTADRLNVLAPDSTASLNVFATGDASDINGGTLPTMAVVAIQKTDYLIKHINSKGYTTAPFRYKPHSLVTYTCPWDGVVQGKDECTGQGAWLD